jgi:hypothetical protein
MDAENVGPPLLDLDDRGCARGVGLGTDRVSRDLARGSEFTRRDRDGAIWLSRCVSRFTRASRSWPQRRPNVPSRTSSPIRSSSRRSRSASCYRASWRLSEPPSRFSSPLPSNGSFAVRTDIDRAAAVSVARPRFVVLSPALFGRDRRRNASRTSNAFVGDADRSWMTRRSAALIGLISQCEAFPSDHRRYPF